MTRIGDSSGLQKTITGQATAKPEVSAADRQGAWLREMQRAQSEAWLSHPLLERPALTSFVSVSLNIAEKGNTRLGDSLRGVGVQRDVPRDAWDSHLPEIRRHDNGERPSTQNSVESDNAESQGLNPAWRSAGGGNLIGEVTKLDSPAPTAFINVGSVPVTAQASGVANGCLEQQISIMTKQIGVERLIAEESVAECSRNGGFATIERAPVQITAQWAGDSVALWLGVAQPQSFDLSAMMRQLRALLDEQGIHVISLVCNGRQWEGVSSDDLTLQQSPLEVREVQ
ncbi:MAG: hypothetical protein QM803_09810 [Rhodocyclaceae bacterium]